jgi:SAM-dependent methyltransferase
MSERSNDGQLRSRRQDKWTGSTDRFGYSWDRFNRPTPDQERQFQLWSAHLNPETDWRGKAFLDAGCGAGRNSYWALSYGASSCVAIDLDDRSLSAARKTLEGFPSATVQKCSIYEIPYENQFDIVFSIGVVHHLSDPPTAVRRLTRAAKPGGQVLVWVYGYENLKLYVNVVNPIRHALFSRMPLSMVNAIAWLPACVLWVLVRVGYTPVEYLKLLRRFSLPHIHHICFDQMLPRIAHYWRQEDAVALLEQAGLENIRVEAVNDVSWSVIGTKP